MKAIHGKSISSASALALFIAIGCANERPRGITEAKTNKEISDGLAITNEAAAEVNGKTFVEIEFRPGSAKLTSNARHSLRALVREASKEGEIDKVMVLSWADNEYPSKNLTKLSKKQIELAAKRGASVQDYIRSLKSVNIEKFNLAERPTTLSKWFNTTDSRLKGTLVAAGLPTTADENQYPSKASHSIVIVKEKD